MKVRELQEKIGATVLTGEVGLDNEIESGYCCDLLSWVMAHGKQGMAWITVQTHMNVIAVSVLMEKVSFTDENVSLQNALPSILTYCENKNTPLGKSIYFLP